MGFSLRGYMKNEIALKDMIIWGMGGSLLIFLVGVLINAVTLILLVG
jgi:hypothetical protein